MFNCKRCKEKDLRILDLKEQMSFLRGMVSPPHDPNKIPTSALEADAVLNGHQHIIHVEAEPEEDEEDTVIRERDRVLAGTY